MEFRRLESQACYAVIAENSYDGSQSTIVSDFYQSDATFTPASAVYLKVAGNALSHPDCLYLDFTNCDYLDFNALALNRDILSYLILVFLHASILSNNCILLI